MEDYERVIAGLTDLSVITAFEVNASCPNTEAGGLEFGATPEGLRELVRRCRAVATRPIAVKLSPVLPDIAGMARVAEQEGADAVTLVNTIPGMLDRRLGNGAGGVSGPALLAIGVLATRKVRTAVAITVLTSHEAGDFERVVGRGVPDLGFEAERLGRLAVAAGLRGVVASGHELALLREMLGPDEIGRASCRERG